MLKAPPAIQEEAFVVSDARARRDLTTDDKDDDEATQWHRQPNRWRFKPDALVEVITEPRTVASVCSANLPKISTDVINALQLVEWLQETMEMEQARPAALKCPSLFRTGCTTHAPRKHGFRPRIHELFTLGLVTLILDANWEPARCHLEIRSSSAKRLAFMFESNGLTEGMPQPLPATPRLLVTSILHIPWGCLGVW